MRAQYLGFTLLLASCGEQVVVRNVGTVCGNGLVEGSEACDDGNTENNDGCTSACVEAACGDAIRRIDAEFEEACDDGNTIDTDACRNDCTVARCGDGVTCRCRAR